LIEVIKEIEQRQQGLEVRDVMRGNAPIYFHAIMAGKEKEREKLMNSQVIELVVGDFGDEKYVDLNVTCIRKGDPDEKILVGVPPVRVCFD